MKKILALLLAIVMILSLASCGLSGGENKGEVTTTSPSTTKPTTTTTTTTTSKPATDNTKLYNGFTPAEKKLFEDYVGVVIPFIPNDEYYVEEYATSNDEGTEVGLNFYAWDNTQKEFNAYKSEIDALYNYDGSDVDDYGDTWYFYTISDGVYLDIAYYLTDDGYVVDVYAYTYTGSSSGSGGGSTDTNHTYTEFTDEEADLFRKYADTSIPFIANDEYYVEEYELPYDDGTGEYGVNFYTFGNTQAEFDYYKSVLDFFYDYDGSEVDEYGDTWYYYTVDYDIYLDLTYYYYDGQYVVEVYVYYIDEIEGSGSSGGSGNDSTDTNDDYITNAGAGLPSGVNGVFDIDFRKADKVKDVTDQGYYLDGCPTTGSPAVLVIPVEFSDVTAASKGYTTSALAQAFGKGGETDYYSVYDYYCISSYGQLTLDVTVLDYWFRPENNSSYYYNATYDYYGDRVAIGDQLIMDEALAYLENKMDLSEFDSDNNGIIDSVVLINTLDIGDDDFYWAYRYWNIYTDDQGYYYEYDGVSANDYLWASYQFLNESYDAEGNAIYTDKSVMNTYTYIHEFGHILGLDDYYDTSYSGNAPLDGADMMDGMLGDHNAYSKFNLGWITNSRLVVADSSVTLTLEDFSKNGDTIIIANNWNEALGVYQEYYVLMYYKNIGLNTGDGAGLFARDGVVVYHVNASLYSEEYDGEIYYDVYNNNTDASDEYGTKDNLIEFVKSAGDTFTYVTGDTLPSNVIDDNGNLLKYTFTIDALTSECATITFKVK